MFSRLEWMIAGRYLRARRKEGAISVIAGFSLVGILLGVGTLIVVMSVMNGFRHELLSRVLGLNGHIAVVGAHLGASLLAHELRETALQRAAVGLAATFLGALVMGEVRAPLAVTAVVVGIFAIFHGHAHGAELPEGASGVAYSLGFVIATGLLHAVGIAIGLIHRWPAGQKILRVAGAGVAAAGVFFLLQAV